MLLIDPITYSQYRLTLVYERTERRGAIFDRLREDVDTVAAVTGMQNVFKLRAADIYRVAEIEQISAGAPEPEATPGVVPAGSAALGELTARLSRCTDLDAIVTTTVNGIAAFLGFAHSLLLLLDEEGRQLFTIASHGYPAEGVGSEVALGDGIIGAAAARATTIRINNVRQMVKYGMSVRRSYERHGEISPGWEIEVPGLPDAESRMAVPAIALGQLVGVLVVESPRAVAFTPEDETNLTVLASLVANAIEAERAREVEEGATVTTGGTRARCRPRPPRRTCASSRSTAARSSTATTSSRVLRVAFSGRSSDTTNGRVGPSSPTRRSVSTRRSSFPSSATTSTAGSCC